jgi:hypothetical protein
MRIVSIRAHGKRIEERRRVLGIDDARMATARNRNKARTAAKRQLLETLADEARRQGRTLPFAANS